MMILVSERKENCYWYFQENYHTDWAYCNDRVYLLYGDWWYLPHYHNAQFFQHVDNRQNIAYRGSGQLSLVLILP